MRSFISVLKDYSTRSIIEYLAKESVKMYNITGEEQQLGATITYPIKVRQVGNILKDEQIMLSAWDIPHIVYLSIQNSNDYHNKQMNDDEITMFVNMFRGYSNKCSGAEDIKKMSLPQLFQYLDGMTYEQFRYQNMGWTLENFNRNYHIFVTSQCIKRDKLIDINEITKEKFGVTAKDLLLAQFLLLSMCSVTVALLDYPETAYSEWVSKASISKILDYYSVTYSDVIASKLGKQIFYTKPFVKAQKKEEYLMTSLYLVQMVFADSLYWLMRDYYLNDKRKQTFPNEFGHMFEDYFEELVNIYLAPNQWHRIQECGVPSADYFVEFENAVLIFELKSGMLGLGAKQQTPDMNQLDDFYNRNIREAYTQLKNSEENYNGQKPVIKIFLLYEYADNSQMIMSAIPEIFEKDNRCYIMSIQDLEVMLVTYKKEPIKLKSIIESMLTREQSPENYKSVLEIIKEQDAAGNLHFTGKRDYLINLLEKLPGFNEWMKGNEV